MPNLKISQFTALAASAQSPNYLLPLADSGVTNYAMTLNSVFSNIGANTATGQVTSTTVSTALSATNLGIVVTRGDNRRTIQARINTDVLPAPQLLISSIVGPLEGDNINRITFQKGDNGGTQAPSTSTLGTVEFSNTTAVCASWEARSLQSSGGNGTVQTWYSTRRNASSVAGIFGIDNWGTFRVSRNLGPLYSDVQLSDPSKLMVIGNVDALNDTSNVCLHILNATTFTNQLNLLLQAVAGQSTNLFECKTSANVKTLQITTAGVLSPGSAAGVDLATAALPFKDFYLAGSSATPGTNNFRITGTATAARVITLPDATITISGSSGALTSGRLPYVATGGLLADSANATLNSSGVLVTAYHTIRSTSAAFLDIDELTSNTTYGLRFLQSGVQRLRLQYAGANGAGNKYIGFILDDADYGIFYTSLNTYWSWWTNGVDRFRVTGTGEVNIGSSLSSTSAQFQVISQSASKIGAIIKGAASQTANLIEWQDSASTLLSGIDASGRFYAPTSLTATTATAGAQTLPANPDGFLLINVNGTQKKVPYYAN